MIPEPLQKAALDYFSYLQFEKRYSPHTVVSYKNDIDQFFQFLKIQFGHVTLTEVSSPYIKSWLASLHEERISPVSINRKVSSVRSFFKYHLREGNVKTNPADVITVLKTAKRLPAFVSSRDTKTLFQHMEFPDTWDGKTHHIILLLLYASGIRLSELINIRENHIDYRRSSLKVLGKGNKERIIPLKKEVLDALKNYSEAKRKEAKNAASDFFLVNAKGKKLYPKYVYLAVNKYLSAVTTIHKKSPHVMRHTFATHLTNNGADLNAVKELLGHSSLAATQVYTHNTIDKLKDIFKKAHPKA
jgi:integrase/recombinase XerC